MAKLRPKREDYRFFLAIPTRWADNDVYGHVNNVVYYEWFDTIVARFLLQSGAITLDDSHVIGLVVETLCRYHAPIGFPDTVMAGLRVARLGNSSVRYEIAIFREGEQEAAADGHFVHVYVDRATQRAPQPLAPEFRAALAALVVEA